tara:strand:- start:2016 stop:4067 length:2052 start_codon:yes stop_codon:yes gene_type:complete
MTKEQHKFTNALINETSPYLLQHAHNPVNWFSWNDDALQKAIDENKPIILSIGYSACHWCHVMEHETFENEEIAFLMNEHFICIKVDREERPDIDQIYMSAIQLMTGHGGWPLNCILLPDKRPFWGGTYFPPDAWKKNLTEIIKLYNNNYTQVVEYAEKLATGIAGTDIIPKQPIQSDYSAKTLTNMIENWKNEFDYDAGGFGNAPKFPMPSSLSFLLEYSALTNNDDIQSFLNTTLHNIAYGGIYDHIGGGFARYSTDKIWKIPHFEKMLYDNAQLVSLYSHAYAKFKTPLYKDVVTQTLDFIDREMTAPEGLFYSGIDADSEGKEGKYYIWDQSELESIIASDYELFTLFYNINENGYWENDVDGVRKYILLRKGNESEIIKEFNIDALDLQSKVTKWQTLLLEERNTRIAPGLDNKHLVSWNGLMSKGYVDAYLTFHDESYLNYALQNAHFIMNHCLMPDGKLTHTFSTDSKQIIDGFLEDYAAWIDALLRLYEATFNVEWLEYAKKLTEYVLENFSDLNTGMFYFTSQESPELIVRKMEVFDNVIPSSNSMMANNLFLLGTLLNDSNYIERSKQILSNSIAQMEKFTSAFSNYASLLLKHTYPFLEVAITGEDVNAFNLSISQQYLPNKLMMGSTKESSLKLLEGKYKKGQNLIYVCQDKVCDAPTSDPHKAIEQIATR